jgi:hypothetical protein
MNVYVYRQIVGRHRHVSEISRTRESGKRAVEVIY